MVLSTRPFRSLSIGVVTSVLVLAAAGGNDGAQAQQTGVGACSKLVEGFGAPRSNKDERSGEYEFICHSEFLVRHNNKSKTPDLVVERLTRDLVTGTNSRPHVNFKPDPKLDADETATDDKYRRSLYARGHQAASADFKSDKDLMIDTFVFSNAVPQEGGGFNSSIWRQFEDRVQKLVKARGEIYVITGPVYQKPGGGEVVIPRDQNPCGQEIRLPDLARNAICGGPSGGPPNQTCGEDGIAIPAGLFKILFDPSMNRMNAYVMPNEDHPNKAERGGQSVEDYLNLWRVSVQNLQDRVGYTFFPEFDRHRSRALLETCPASMIR